MTEISQAVRAAVPKIRPNYDTGFKHGKSGLINRNPHQAGGTWHKEYESGYAAGLARKKGIKEELMAKLYENIEHEHIKNLLAKHDINVHHIADRVSENTRKNVFINNPQEKHESGKTNLAAAHDALVKHGLYPEYIARNHAAAPKGAFSQTSTI